MKKGGKDATIRQVLSFQISIVASFRFIQTQPALLSHGLWQDRGMLMVWVRVKGEVLTHTSNIVKHCNMFFQARRKYSKIQSSTWWKLSPKKRIGHFCLQDYAHSTIFLPLQIAWVLSECSDVARSVSLSRHNPRFFPCLVVMSYKKDSAKQRILETSWNLLEAPLEVLLFPYDILLEVSWSFVS